MGSVCGDTHEAKVKRLEDEHIRLTQEKQIMEMRHRNANTAAQLQAMSNKLDEKEQNQVDAAGGLVQPKIIVAVVDRPTNNYPSL